MGTVRSRRLLVPLAGMLLVTGVLAGASTASADSTQVQSYQRASQEQACSAQPGETPWQANWGSDSSWKPSWEQWANGGKGGWTCTRSITWARGTADSSRVYNLGDTGPGGGLVFYIDSGSGLRYEMAPKAWSGVATPDVEETWCDAFTTVPGTTGTAIGTGAANTAALAASGACNSNVAAAVLAYPGTNSSAGQWFLPSQDELNAMCNYSRVWVGSPPAPRTGTCTGVQDATFASGRFGFASAYYWSSSNRDTVFTWVQFLDDGVQFVAIETNTLRMRPIRAF